MAREFGKVYMTIWSDPDFITLDILHAAEAVR